MQYYIILTPTQAVRMCLINMGVPVQAMTKFLSSVALTLQTNIMPAVPFHALVYILVVALQWNVFALISLQWDVVGHASSFAKDQIAMLCCEVLVLRSYKNPSSSCYSSAAAHCSNVWAGSTNGAMLYERISAENWCCSNTLVELSLCIVSPQRHTGNFANTCSFLIFFLSTWRHLHMPSSCLLFTRGDGHANF